MTKGVIATPHRLASEVGAQVLRDGGNAVDALVAADAVLCVVYPHMTSVAGDLMALVWPAGSEAPISLIGAGRSGEKASLEAVRERGFDTMPERGVLPVTVPGTVEAWGRLLERFGTMGFGALMDAAEGLARDGYTITAQLSDFLKAAASLLGRERAAYALYPPMDAGMTLRNSDLASVLHEIGRAGLNSFYRGKIADAIVGAIEKRDGFITRRDLATHRSQWVEPVVFRYRDVEVYELPPPTQGLAAAAMLVRLEAGQSFKVARDAAYALRNCLITDPDFSPTSYELFLDPSQSATAGVEAHEHGDTVYLCAADEQGNLVSMIQSIAFDFGSGIVAEGTGMLLQNRGAYFSLDPAHVNRLEPKKRTMHTLIPAMAAREGKPWAAFGGMGGDLQPQIQAQVLVNLVDGLPPEEAVARPRLAVLPDGATTAVEADHPEARELNRRGADVQLMPARHHLFGHAHAIVVDGPNQWRAGADPRSDGSVEYVG